MVKRNKTKEVLKLAGSLILLTLLVAIAQNYFFRIDLTAEKRYSLSKNTKQLMNSLEKDLYFEIYLSGVDLPHGFKKLQKSCIEMLNELTAVSNVNIHYELIDVSKISNPQKKNEAYTNLLHRGLKPTSVQERTKDGSLKQRIIIPGLIVHDTEKEISVHLLKNATGTAEEKLNHSVETLEFELTKAIRILLNKKYDRIAFLTGHGELNEFEVADFTASLLQNYEVERIKANQLCDTSKNYSALIIAQPRNEFSKEDKYQIDQYLMNGGRILWLIDEVMADMDSLSVKESTVSFYKALNLNDQLFTYGLRINPDLIMDIQGQLIPVQTALPGEPAQFTPASWYYSPLLNMPDSHPITRKLNMVKVDFANSIDWVGNEQEDLKKTSLLTSSDYTRLDKVPGMISLKILNQKPNLKFFSAGKKKIAVLLEGKFNSAFKNRAWKGIDKQNFKSKSKNTKMIVISDGDIAKNKLRGVGENRQVEALGYDRYSGKTYGNKAFLLNCVDYLCDSEAWMDLRTRQVKLRLLDKAKIRDERLFWQLVNVIMPLFFLGIFGGMNHVVRKKRYTKNKLGA